MAAKAYCNDCEQDLPVELFYRMTSRKNGLQPRCKPCDRRRALVRRYGITVDDYERMLAEQFGQCAICELAESEARDGLLCVDHCHDTNRVRGLLCHRCNVGLSFFDDSPETLRRAVGYLA